MPTQPCLHLLGMAKLFARATVGVGRCYSPVVVVFGPQKRSKVLKSGEMADFGVFFRCVAPRWGVCARFDPRNIVRVPYKGKLGG